MIHSILAAAALATTPPAVQDNASPEEIFAHFEASIVALDDGDAVYEYVLCYIDRRNRVSPYVEFLPPENLYQQYIALNEAFSAQASHFNHEEEQALLKLVEDRVDERVGPIGCRYILIPSPEHAQIVAERAAYYRDAMLGKVDAQAELTTLITEQVAKLGMLPDGATLLAVGACQQRHRERFRGSYIPTERLSEHQNELNETLDWFSARYSRFMMSEALFDEDAIWTAAYDARVPEMSQSECESLLAPYIAN